MRPDYSLYLVADADFAAGAGHDLCGLVDEAVAGGVTIVQLRAKLLPARDLAEIAFELLRRLGQTGVPLLINDRADVALACGAAGVHLGQQDLPVSLARRLLGGEAVIGVSVHTAAEALSARRQGADYVGAGPAYPTATKETTLPVLGPDGIREIQRTAGLPVVAIGGIDAGKAAEMAAAGAGGIAVVSAILGAPDARQAAAELRRAFKR
jgi:thiamine-phosphate pyrophosphorylase